MTATALLDRIGNVFIHHLNMQAPSPDIDVIESGTIDSLTFVELLAHLERERHARCQGDPAGHDRDHAQQPDGDDHRHQKRRREIAHVVVHGRKLFSARP